MNPPARMVVFGVGAGGLAVLFALAFAKMPAFGSVIHLYRTLAVRAAVAHRTANVVSSINFDQRGLDTLGEETILLASVVGAAVLLRPSHEESQRRPPPQVRVLEITRLAGYVLLPVTLIVGFDVVTHGHLTPGGGFQGGVVLATGLHLLYVSSGYQALERLRPLGVYETGEAVGAAAFGGLGLAGIVVAGEFLANILPLGTFGQLLSAGTIPILNVAVGLEVASGMVVLLANFLQQYILLSPGARQAGAHG
jgi:multicomponent Na+:H+ antiporter subunit B